MKFMSKKLSKQLEKKSMSSSNFYLNGGEPQEKDERFDKFMESRFNSPIQNMIMTKNAHNVMSQYFHRIEMSPEEMARKQTDVQSLAFPGSLMDLIFNSGNEALSQTDQDSLYSMWKNSNTNGSIGVSSGDISKAEKLMNRGYVIADNKKGQYQLTEKGRKVLIGRILGNDPKVEKPSAMKKTSSMKKLSLRKSDFEGESAIINFGGVKSLLIRNTPENIRLLNSVGAEKYAKPDKINNWLTIAVENIPQLEESGLSKEEPSSVSDWVNDTQNYHKYIPNSNSPLERMPYGASTSKSLMNKFSSSKIFSIIEKSKKINKESILNNGLEEMNNRGLKIKMIASDDTSRQKGLMFSEPIKSDECALFVFDKPGNYSFWNRNVSFPIDVAFYDSEKRLIHVGQLDSHQERSVGCGENRVKYVVETKKDWFKENGISPGSSIYEILEKNPSV